jgi:hypothetical protein
VERGLDFEPAPAPVIDALPELTVMVEGLAARCRDAQERRWLAAALAALSHHVQAGTLTEPPPRPDTTDGGDLVPVPTLAVGAAVAVVTSPLGVLPAAAVTASRDGWSLAGPSRTARPPSRPRSASVPRRLGLVVVAEHEIGHRTHPVTTR